MPVDRARVGGPRGRADLGDPLRRPPRHQRAARDRGVRLAARRVPRLDHVVGDHRGAGRRGRQAALRPVRDAAVLRLQHGRLLRATGSRSARPPTPTKLPKLFWVNWFRKGDDGKFLWPGFGDNSRVLKWVIERGRGHRRRVDTPIGRVPTADAIDTDGPRHRRGDDRRSCVASTPRAGGRRSPRSRSTTRPSASACPTSCATSSTSSRSASPASSAGSDAEKMTGRRRLQYRRAHGYGGCHPARRGDRHRPRTQPALRRGGFELCDDAERPCTSPTRTQPRRSSSGSPANRRTRCFRCRRRWQPDQVARSGGAAGQREQADVAALLGQRCQLVDVVLTAEVAARGSSPAARGTCPRPGGRRAARTAEPRARRCPCTSWRVHRTSSCSAATRSIKPDVRVHMIRIGSAYRMPAGSCRWRHYDARRTRSPGGTPWPSARTSSSRPRSARPPRWPTRSPRSTASCRPRTSPAPTT